MSSVSSPTPVSRYVALDVHRSYHVVGAVDDQQQVVLTPRRFGFETFLAWAPTHLGPSDVVVLEATSNAWVLYDQLHPLVASVTVAHPLAVKLISAARVNTDAGDTLKLARLLAAHLIPAVWVPPLYVRELRSLVAHRRRLIKQRTQARNRLHGVLQRQNLAAPAGKAFAVGARSWWLSLELSAAERLRVRQDLALLDALEPLITEVEAHLGELSTNEQWNQQVPLLLQLPGVGMLSAMTILAAIGEISRFPSPKQRARLCRAGSAHSCLRAGEAEEEGSPRRAAVTCGSSWLRPPGSLSNTILIGKRSLSDSVDAWASRRRWSRSLANSWWRSGMC